MKKGLLFASLLLVGASVSAQETRNDAVKESETYATTQGVTCENLWSLSRGSVGNDVITLNYAFSGNYSVATIVDGEYIYVFTSDPTTFQLPEGNQACFEKFNMMTGEFLGRTFLTLDGAAYSGTLCANTAGIDEAGNAWVASYGDNQNATVDSYPGLYFIDLTTGVLTPVPGVETMLFDGQPTRIDYLSIVGDLKGETMGCSIMGASCMGDNNRVHYWTRGQGEETFIGGWSDGSYAQEIVETYPAGTVGFNTGSMVRICRPSNNGVAELFYIDANTTGPALYSTDLTMLDNLGNADLQATAEDGTVSGTLPQASVGTNGICEVKLGDTNLMVYSISQYDAGDDSNKAVIGLVDENLSMESMQYLWTVPAGVGLGESKGGGRRYHTLEAYETEENGKPVAYFVTYKESNGMAVYKLGLEGDGGVAANVAETAQIRVNGDVIAVSETAESIEVYNIAGQKVAEAQNATEVAAPQNGVYVVKAVVAGTPVVKKVIL